jgi:hypothetical protein
VYDIESETMDVIDLKFINNVIAHYGGKVFLLIDEKSYDDDGDVIPEMDMNLVIIAYPFEEEIDEEDDTDNEFGLW